MPKTEKSDIGLIRTWTLSAAMTLGSSVRAKGILQEIQALLPTISKKSISLDGNELTLEMTASEKTTFNAAAGVVSGVMAEAETLPVIPREIQDILAIRTSERHRSLADGRLPSAGTRTVRLNGRARQITFHVFDPKVVEDLLDWGIVDEWRGEDAEAKAEKRLMAAFQRKMERSLKRSRNRARRMSAPSMGMRKSFVGGMSSTRMVSCNNWNRASLGIVRTLTNAFDGEYPSEPVIVQARSPR